MTHLWPILMSVLPQIIEWSQERPLWQQDALRRLVEQPKLDTSDYDELVALCKADAGLDVGDIDPARGLADGVTTHGAAGAPVVRLSRIDNVKNVNSLRDDQTLSIAPNGLTVAYGDNGAGKSGYVRVLKQLCRARGARDAVHPNVYSDPTGPTSATVYYEIIASGSSLASGEVDTGITPRTVVWGPGIPGPDELAQVSVFDSRSASVYVTEENAVAYLPHGTDLFPKLVSVAEIVRSYLDQEIAEIDLRRDRFESIPVGTEVFEALASLHVSSAKERIDKLATVTDAERASLVDLRAQERRLQTEDPTAKAKELRRCVTRLNEARGRLETLKKALDASKIADLKAARMALDSARTAAELASGSVFSDAPIVGVGSDVWRELWRAARKFAEHGVIPPRPFPTGPTDDPRCVLCQQPLDGDSAARMERFEEFVRGETRTQVDHAIKELEIRVRSLEKLEPNNIADRVLLDEIAAFDMDLVALLNDCTNQLSTRRDVAIAAAKAEVAPAQWETFVHMPTGVLTRLGQLVKRLDDEAANYEITADPETLKRVSSAIREIEARLTLDSLRERVYAEIDRQQRKMGLRNALSTTNTAGITRRNTEILKEVVTEPLTDTFAEHIRTLGLTHLPVGVTSSGGEKGRAFHSLALEKNASIQVSTDEVLSEGEHRGVALAAFLAEISLQDSASTVVFDDPVSSMDHSRREFVARRIVEIAKIRPVLVFTHDLVFLLLLQRTADKQLVPVHPRYFRRDGTRAGLVVEDWPWDGQTVKTRLGVLKQMIQGFEKLAKTDRPHYETDVRSFYDRLRTTWERAVEEVLFNGAIRRFGKEVQTQRLKNLHRLNEQHLIDLEAGMTRTSDWIQGHDHAADLSLPVPEPHEAAADLDALERWVTAVKKDLKN